MSAPAAGPGAGVGVGGFALAFFAAADLIATAARIDTEPQSGPEALVSLRPITQANLSAILGLRPSSAQQAFVASNAVSLAEAHFDENAWYRAIYADEVPVGFVMVSDDGASHETFLWRLMVDQRYQRQGFGRRAVKLLIDYVKTRPGATELLVSHGQGDGNPGPFYQDLGFQYTGDRIGGELVMRLPLE